MKSAKWTCCFHATENQFPYRNWGWRISSLHKRYIAYSPKRFLSEKKCKFVWKKNRIATYELEQFTELLFCMISVFIRSCIVMSISNFLTFRIHCCLCAGFLQIILIYFFILHFVQNCLSILSPSPGSTEIDIVCCCMCLNNNISTTGHESTENYFSDKFDSGFDLNGKKTHGKCISNFMNNLLRILWIRKY